MGRAAIYALGMYALLIGGTFSGVTIVRAQRVSLGLLTVAVAFWLVMVWRAPAPTMPGSPFLGLAGFWGVVLAVSGICASSGRSLIALWYVALYVAIWVVLSDVRQRGVPASAFSDLLIIAALPLIFWAFAQVLPWYWRWFALRDTGVPFYPARPVATLGNPNLLGSMLALMLPFGLVRGLRQTARLGRAVMAIWLLAVATVLYMTYSRGAWLAAGAAVACLGALRIGKQARARRVETLARGCMGSHRRVAALGVMSAVAIVGAGLMIALAWQAFASPQREIGTRLRLFAIALERFAANPLHGTGLYTFGRELSGHLSIPPKQPHAHAHNLALTVAAELGLPGLIALGITAAWVGLEIARNLRVARTTAERDLTAAAGAALAGVAVHSLADVTLLVPAIAMAVLVTLAAGIAPRAGEDTPVARRGLRYGITALWGGLLLTGWAWSAVYGVYVRGEQLVVAGAYREAVDVLGVAARRAPWNTLFRAEYAYAAGLAAGQGDRPAAEIAVDAYRAALAREPDQALWWANLAAVEWGQGRANAALAAMQRAVAAAPDAAELWLNLGRFYEGIHQRDGAWRAYRRALQLAPRIASSDFWRETPLRRVAVYTSAPRRLPQDAARQLWLAGGEQRASALLHAHLTSDPAQPRPLIEIARLALWAGEVERAARYLDAAALLGQLEGDAAWTALLRADIAARQGDAARADALQSWARALASPDSSGYRLLYGVDIAHYQFLSLTVPGKLLPQLVVLGPDPALVRALAR